MTVDGVPPHHLYVNMLNFSIIWVASRFPPKQLPLNPTYHSGVLNGEAGRLPQPVGKILPEQGTEMIPITNAVRRERQG